MMFLFLFIVMVISNPSESKFEEWVFDHYGYKCDEDGVCQKDNTEVLVMSQHYKNAGIFMSVERSIEIPGHKNGETETIRAFGIFNSIYTVKDNWFWDIVS